MKLWFCWPKRSFFSKKFEAAPSKSGANTREGRKTNIAKHLKQGDKIAKDLNYSEWLADWQTSPACKAIDEATLEKIVTYYAQDYECFGCVLFKDVRFIVSPPSIP